MFSAKELRSEDEAPNGSRLDKSEAVLAHLSDMPR